MIEREIKERVIDGISIRYIGKLPEKRVSFSLLVRMVEK